MSCDKFSRMIIKRGTGKATIPISSDHRNGDWIATDVYDGEWYQNISDGQMYIRNDRDILAVGDPVLLQQKLTVKQTGTSAPVITFLSDTFNGAGTIVWTRLSAGEYEGTLTGVFTADKTFLQIDQTKNADEQTRIYRKTTSKVEIRTFKGGALTDGILNENSVIIEIYP